MSIYYKNKKIINIISIILISILFFGVAHDLFAAGAIDAAVTTVLGWIASLVFMVCGWVLTITIKSIIAIAGYNEFINEVTIIQAWQIIRDMCNMFFILILLIIAFATILRIESYNVKKLLPKLLIMAVLINFSRTICGLAIDFSQIIMLTFVNAFSGGGGNFIAMLKTKEFTEFATTNVEWGDGKTIDLTNTAGSMIVAVILTIVATIAMLAILVVFVMRIIMLWIYVVLSPLAFLLSAFPAGQKYASQYWGEFTRYLINGPVLAFFIWLALMTMQGTKFTDLAILDSAASATTISILTTPNFISFVMAIGFIVGGLMVSQQVGGVGSSFGKNMANKVKDRGVGMARSAGRGAVGAGLMGADWLNRRQGKITGMDLNPKRFSTNVKTFFDKKKGEDLARIDVAANRNLNRGGVAGLVTGFSSHDHLDNYWGRNGAKQIWKGGAAKREKLLEEADKKKRKMQYLGKVERLNELKKKDIYKGPSEFEEADKVDLNLYKTKREIKEQDRLEKETTSMENDTPYIKFEGTPEQLVAEKNKLKDESKSLYTQANEIKIKSTEGKQNLRSSIAAQEKNVVSENEDELCAEFSSALRDNNIFLAAAIAKKTAKSGGMNTMLENMGYNVLSGLTAKEAEKAKADGTYDSKKGFNDFMRDIFGDKLGMDDQSYLALQNDIAGIGESNSHAYLRKTVTVDEGGNLAQSDTKSRQFHRMVEDSKGDVEKSLRNNNRLEYGGENINDHKFEWSDDGLALFLSRISTVNKEIDGNRLNKNAAAKITMSDRALAKLERALRSSTMVGRRPKDKDGKEISVEEFMAKLISYGKQAALSNDEDAIDEVLDASKE